MTVRPADEAPEVTGEFVSVWIATAEHKFRPGIFRPAGRPSTSDVFGSWVDENGVEIPHEEVRGWIYRATVPKSKAPLS